VQAPSLNGFYVGAQINGLDVINLSYAEVLGISNAEGGYFCLCGFVAVFFLAGRLEFWHIPWLRFKSSQAKLLTIFSILANFRLLAGPSSYLAMMDSIALGGISFANVVDVPTHLWIALEGLEEDSKFAAGLSRHGPIVGGSNHADLTRNDPRSWRFQL